MSRFQSQLNTAVRLIESYRTGEPFHLYLKQYFAANRKHGSSDRRTLRDLCYAYFRIGKLWADLDVSDQMLAAYYLVIKDPMPLIAAIRPDWPAPTSISPADRAALIKLSWIPDQVFPWVDRLSDAVEATAFAASMLKQPDLFIRIRPGHEKSVLQKLERDQTVYQLIDDHCVALSNATSLESRFEIDREIVVQDRSSQRIAELFQALPQRESWRVWDACAASGGKSILAYDHLPNVELTCTDLRPNILRNLQSRLQRAGVPVMQVGVEDLTKKRDRSAFGSFDLILADVPCTGSGTWSRTPENLCSFEASSIDSYAARQYSILLQLLPSLRIDGYLMYMTCSVFADENERLVQRICEAQNVEIVTMKMFTGYLDRADSLFAALLKRSS